MKKNLLWISLFIVMITSTMRTSAETLPTISFLGITVTFSTHAYWDGATQSCLPRPRGWCLHFEINAPAPVPGGTVYGQVSNDQIAGITLSFNKRIGISAETLNQFFKDGKFILDGTATLSEDVAKKLGLSPTYVIPEGTYTYKETGDIVTIQFKK